MTPLDDVRKDYRCTVTLLLDDATDMEARAFFADGAEVECASPTSEAEGLIASIESPGPIERQP